MGYMRGKPQQMEGITLGVKEWEDKGYSLICVLDADFVLQATMFFGICLIGGINISVAILFISKLKKVVGEDAG